MHIHVQMQIPAYVRVTLAFERLTLPEALQRLERYVNYAYITRRAGRISAMMVYARSNTSLPAAPAVDASQPRESTPGQAAGIGRRAPSVNALELEIDPRQYLQKNPQ
jgi:hypothetical protein